MPHLRISFQRDGKTLEYHPAETHYELPTEHVARQGIQSWINRHAAAQTNRKPQWLKGAVLDIVADESGKP